MTSGSTDVKMIDSVTFQAIPMKSTKNTIDVFQKVQTPPAEASTKDYGSGNLVSLMVYYNVNFYGDKFVHKLHSPVI